MTLPLEQQVTSLALSKRLKELGVKQRSLFAWHEYTPSYYMSKPTIEAKVVYGREHENDIAAFTVAELGEMLPREIENDELGTQYFSMSRQTNPSWCCYYGNLESEGPSESADTEAEARGLMYEYLIKNNLIEV